MLNILILNAQFQFQLFASTCKLEELELPPMTGDETICFKRVMAMRITAVKQQLTYIPTHQCGNQI